MRPWRTGRFWTCSSSGTRGHPRAGGAIRHTAAGIGLAAAGQPQDAEECVSDTYLAAWNAIPPEEPVYLFAYLAAICRNKALTHLERERASKRRGEVVALTEELESCIPDRRREQEADSRELGEALSRFLAELGEEPRRFFLRRYWYAESVKEVAKHCGVSEIR